MTIEKSTISEMVQLAIQAKIARPVLMQKVEESIAFIEDGIMEGLTSEYEQLDESVLSKLAAMVSTTAGAAVGAVGTAAVGAAGVLAGGSGGAINYLTVANMIKMLSLINPFNGVTMVGLSSSTKILGTAVTIPGVGLAGTTIGTLPVSWIALAALAGAGAGALTGYMAYRGIKYAMRPKSVKLAEKIAKLVRERDGVMYDISMTKDEKDIRKFEKLTNTMQKLGADLEREIAREEREAGRVEFDKNNKFKREDVDKVLQLVKDGRMTYADSKGVPALARESVENGDELFLSEEVQQQINEAILNEGFGSTVIRILGAIGGYAVGGWAGSVVGSLAGAGIGGLLMAVGFSAPILVATTYGGMAAGTIAGMIWGAMKGYEIASNLTGGNHEKAVAKLLKVTKSRDELLTKLAEDAKAGNQASDSDAKKIDNLTTKQVQAAQYLERQANIAKAAGKLSGEDVKVVDDLIAKGSQGKLTLIKTK